MLTFIPNQDTVHCEPPWWKTTSTWNLMLNDPILNVLFLCFMSLTLTPTKVFFVSIFFAECKRSPLWSNCHCQNVPSGQPPKVRIIKSTLNYYIPILFLSELWKFNVHINVSKSPEIVSKSNILKQWTKGHSFCKQCLHDLQFMKTGSSLPNLSKLARSDISCQFMKTRSLCRTVYKINGFYS